VRIHVKERGGEGGGGITIEFGQKEHSRLAPITTDTLLELLAKMLHHTFSTKTDYPSCGVGGKCGP
jgi:hypothetical protein